LYHTLLVGLVKNILLFDFKFLLLEIHQLIIPDEAFSGFYNFIMMCILKFKLIFYLNFEM